MSLDPDPEASSTGHRYALYEAGQVVGQLEWRSSPRALTGWYLRRGAGIVRAHTDPGRDELAADRSEERAWQLHAEVAAILSTAIALDAAARALHPQPQRPRGRFRRLS